MTHYATVLNAALEVGAISRTLPDNIPQGFVRLHLATASLCGTDLHYYRHFANAGFVMQRPVTLGHEACAFVTDANGSTLQVGQLVALNPIIACGKCNFCVAGMENHCSSKRFPGSATTVPHVDGFFQEEFDFPVHCCHVVPEGTDPSLLTFAEPLACTMHSVAQSGVGKGDRLLVTGCGPMGLLAIVAAKSIGAVIHASDLRSGALELARRVGAEATYLGETMPPASSYDAVIEASGSPHAFNLALEAVKKRGTVSILSTIQPSQVPVNLHRIMLKEIVVRGSFQFNEEFSRAVDLIVKQPEAISHLIAARFPLSQIGKALDFMLSGQAAGKILIEPEN